MWEPGVSSAGFMEGDAPPECGARAHPRGGGPRSVSTTCLGSGAGRKSTLSAPGLVPHVLPWKRRPRRGELLGLKFRIPSSRFCQRKATGSRRSSRRESDGQRLVRYPRVRDLPQKAVMRAEPRVLSGGHGAGESEREKR